MRSNLNWAAWRWVAVLALLAVVLSRAEAAPVAPEILYEIQAALPEPRSGDLEEWNFTGGGYVLRVDLDITGDGLPELFVATTLSMYRGSPMWRVYCARPEGGYAPFLTPAEMKAGWTAERTLQIDSRFGFSKGEIKGKPAIAIPWHNRFAEEEEERWGETLIQFKGAVMDFFKSRLEENWEGDSFSGTPVPLEELARGVMVVDLLRDPNAAWRPISLGRGIPSGDGYFVDPVDEARVKRLGAFTPELAWRWLQQAYAGRRPQGQETDLDVGEAKPGVQTGLADATRGSGIPSGEWAPRGSASSAGMVLGLLRRVVDWRGPLSGGATLLVAGWGVVRWCRRRGDAD